MVLDRFVFCFVIVFGLCRFTNGQETPPLPGTHVVEPPKQPPCSLQKIYAKCDIEANPNKPSDINGTIYFMQTVRERSCTYGFLFIQVVIDNVPTTDDTRNHGFHIHKYGDMSDGCESMGPHYNPYGAKHGSPWHKPAERHLGDLGNVRQKMNGDINLRKVEYFASLYGWRNVAGRGVVLHALEDDLGMNKTSPGSSKTGNAGGRLACCVIRISKPFAESVFTLYK